MRKELEKIRDERIEEIIKYAEAHKKPKFDKNGNPIDVFVDSNPIVITEKFFKRVDNGTKGIILYTKEQLEEYYELYRELILAVNEYAGIFPTSLTTFCKLIGVTIDVLKQYRETADIEMKKTIDTIYDEINDDNLFLSQLGQTNEKSTIFKLKSQNELTEKRQPNVNISLKGVMNQAKYDKTLEKYSNLLLKGDK
ncbi:MAG: hypothetical protein IJR03_00225 [Bacteroidales bacterium]|nr:hypothetical protein [Bacteroidales bacterium]